MTDIANALSRFGPHFVSDSFVRGTSNSSAEAVEAPQPDMASPSMEAANPVEDAACDAQRKANALRQSLARLKTETDSVARKLAPRDAGGKERAHAQSNGSLQGQNLAPLGESAADVQLHFTLFSTSLRALAASGLETSLEGKQKTEESISELFKPIPDVYEPSLLLRTFLEPLSQVKYEIISDSELWDKISEVIGDIKNNYVGIFEHVNSKYIEFYQAFSVILSKLAGWQESADEGKNMWLHVEKLENELIKLKGQYQNVALFPVKGTTTQSQALAWAKELGLPDSCVKWQEGGGYIVVMDMQQIDTMLNGLKALGDRDSKWPEWVKVDSYKFQAWQTGFKTQEDNLKNFLMILFQKYNGANSNGDSMIKILSGTIAQCTEANKAYFS